MSADGIPASSLVSSDRRVSLSRAPSLNSLTDLTLLSASPSATSNLPYPHRQDPSGDIYPQFYLQQSSISSSSPNATPATLTPLNQPRPSPSLTFVSSLSSSPYPPETKPIPNSEATYAHFMAQRSKRRYTVGDPSTIGGEYSDTILDTCMDMIIQFGRSFWRVSAGLWNWVLSHRRFDGLRRRGQVNDHETELLVDPRFPDENHVVDL